MNKKNKQIIFKVIITVLILLVIKLLYDEFSYITFMFQYLFMGRPWAAIPLPRNIQNAILRILKELPPNKYTFIDFGCADGNVIDLVYSRTNEAVCIELEKYLTDIAEKRFKDIKNVKVLNQDMNDYMYTDTPTILFLYEPLWSMKKEDAIPIYQKIFAKIPKDIKPFYIIYVSGVNPHLDETFFKNLDFSKVSYLKLSRFLGLKSNNVYLFKRN
jgi:hypothetical protein